MQKLPLLLSLRSEEHRSGRSHRPGTAQSSRVLGAQPPPPLPTSPFGWVPRTSRVLGGAGAELAHPVCPKTPGGAQGNALGELKEEHSVPLGSSKPSHAPEVAHQKKTPRIPKLPRKRPEVLGDQTAQPREGTAGSSASLQAHTQRGRATSTAWAPTPAPPPPPPLGFAKPVDRKRQQQGPRRPLSFFFGENIHVSDEQFGTQAPWPCFTRLPFQRLLAC